MIVDAEPSAKWVRPVGVEAFVGGDKVLIPLILRNSWDDFRVDDFHQVDRDSKNGPLMCIV